MPGMLSASGTLFCLSTASFSVPAESISGKSRGAFEPDRRPAADVFSFKLTAQSLIQAIGRGASSIAFAPATVLAGIASSFEDQRFAALGTENIFCPYLVPGSRLDRLYLFGFSLPAWSSFCTSLYISRRALPTAMGQQDPLLVSPRVERRTE